MQPLHHSQHSKLTPEQIASPEYQEFERLITERFQEDPSLPENQDKIKQREARIVELAKKLGILPTGGIS